MTLRLGTSTREEVHDLLGEPNLLKAPRHALWEVERDPFQLSVIGVAGLGGGAVPVYGLRPRKDHDCMDA